MQSSPTDDPPARKRKKLRKDEIVVEATKLFAERGYEGASMGDLADRVGLRKASLFHHFPSKDVLYATVLQQLLESVKKAVENAVAEGGDFESRVTRLSDTIVTQLGEQPHAARLLVREAMDNGPVMRDQLSGTVDAMLNAACTFFQAGQAHGTFEPSLVPKQVCVTMMGLYIMPFAVNEVVERFHGTSPFEASFIEERKAAIRMQMLRMILKKK